MTVKTKIDKDFSGKRLLAALGTITDNRDQDMTMTLEEFTSDIIVKANTNSVAEPDAVWIENLYKSYLWVDNLYTGTPAVVSVALRPADVAEPYAEPTWVIAVNGNSDDTFASLPVRQAKPPQSSMS